MPAGDPLGLIEYNVLDAVNRGALRGRCTARQVTGLREQAAGEAILHDVLRRFEHAGLLSSARDGVGRQYRLTGAGRARLRSERGVRTTFAAMMLRGDIQRAMCSCRVG